MIANQPRINFFPASNFISFSQNFISPIYIFRWSRSGPSTPPRLAQSYNSYWVDISFGNVRQFWFICL